MTRSQLNQRVDGLDLREVEADTALEALVRFVEGEVVQTDGMLSGTGGYVDVESRERVGEVTGKMAELTEVIGAAAVLTRYDPTTPADD